MTEGQAVRAWCPAFLADTREGQHLTLLERDGKLRACAQWLSPQICLIGRPAARDLAISQNCIFSPGAQHLGPDKGSWSWLNPASGIVQLACPPREERPMLLIYWPGPERVLTVSSLLTL